MNIANCKTANSTPTLTSRAGLMVLGEQIRRLGLTDLVDQLMPQAPRNHAYQSSTLMLMMHDGPVAWTRVGRCSRNRR